MRVCITCIRNTDVLRRQHLQSTTCCVERAGRCELSVKCNRSASARRQEINLEQVLGNTSVSVRGKPPLKTQKWTLKMEVVLAWSRDLHQKFTSSSTMANLMLFYQLLTVKDFTMIFSSGWDFSFSFYPEGNYGNPRKNFIVLFLLGFIA